MGTTQWKALPTLLLLLLVSSATVVAADPVPVSLMEDGQTWDFSEPWRYRAGDDPAWASPHLDDSSWLLTTTILRSEDRAWVDWNGNGWFRHRFTIDPKLIGVPLTLWIRQAGSSEIYIDGVSFDPARTDLVLCDGVEHLVVVRYENDAIDAFHRDGFPAGFVVSLSDIGLARDREEHMRRTTGLQLFLTAFPLAFAVVHLALFSYMPRNRGNLVYTVLLILWSATVFFDYQAAMAPDWAGQLANLRIQRLAGSFRDIVLLAFVYTVLASNRKRRFWVLTAAAIVAGAMAAFKPEANQWAQIAVGLVILIEVTRTVISALRRGHKDASLFAVAIAALFGFGSYDVLLDLELMTPIAGIHNAYFVGYLVFLVCMSVFLARDFAHTNRRVVEQQQAARDRKREMELLAADNLRKTKELEEARELQLSMLPSSVPVLPSLAIGAAMETATEVGGDYYDFHVGSNETLTAAIGDVTGHGMRAGTLVAAVKSLFAALGGNLQPALFLQRCSVLIRGLKLGRLHMAMQIVRIEGNQARVATAGIPPALVYRKQEGSVEELAPGGLPLGTRLESDYEEITVGLAPGDTLLLTSDGLAELAAPDGKALGYSGVAEAFQRIGAMAPTEIVAALLEVASSWRNGVPQEDDITLVVLQAKSP
ncbi:MAG: SpoIIE family protein phosphatase [bacterium]|nr:SpoIIE family protein phosphatase [bacterium]